MYKGRCMSTKAVFGGILAALGDLVRDGAEGGYRTGLTRRSRDRENNEAGPRFGRVQACGVDVVFDRRTVLRYPVTPGKSSRWPACRGRRPGRGPPRTFSRGDGVSENRPAVEDDIHAACLYSAESRSGLIFLTVPTPPRQSGPVSALF